MSNLPWNSRGWRNVLATALKNDNVPGSTKKVFEEFTSTEKYTRCVNEMKELLKSAQETFGSIQTLENPPENTVLTTKMIATIIAAGWFAVPGAPLKLTPLATNLVALKSIINYIDASSSVERKVIIKRVEGVQPDWGNSRTVIGEVSFYEGTGESGEDDHRRDIPGGAVCEFVVNVPANLGQCNPFEIPTFLMYPECLMACVLCPTMKDNNACIVLGATKYSNENGNPFSDDVCPVVDDYFRQRSIILIDASTKTSAAEQLVGDFLRDLNKAYYGVSGAKREGLVDANWLVGDVKVKFIQMLLACSQAGKSLVYHTFDDDIQTSVAEFIQQIPMKMTVGEFIRLYAEKIKSANGDAFDIMN